MCAYIFRNSLCASADLLAISQCVILLSHHSLFSITWTTNELLRRVSYHLISHHRWCVAVYIIRIWDCSSYMSYVDSWEISQNVFKTFLCKAFTFDCWGSSDAYFVRFLLKFSFFIKIFLIEHLLLCSYTEVSSKYRLKEI